MDLSSVLRPRYFAKSQLNVAWLQPPRFSSSENIQFSHRKLDLQDPSSQPIINFKYTTHKMLYSPTGQPSMWISNWFKTHIIPLARQIVLVSKQLHPTGWSEKWKCRLLHRRYHKNDCPIQNIRAQYVRI